MSLVEQCFHIWVWKFMDKSRFDFFLSHTYNERCWTYFVTTVCRLNRQIWRFLSKYMYIIHTFFDRDARRSGPTIHFHGFVTLVQICYKLMETWCLTKNWIRLDQIGSDWIRLDQIGSDWIKLDDYGENCQFWSKKKWINIRFFVFQKGINVS